jgi:hypothetical protein
MALSWCSKRFFDRPAFLEPPRKRHVGDSDPARPATNTQSNSIVRNELSATSHVTRQRRGGQRTFDCPPRGKSPTQRSVVNSELTRPSLEAHGFTVVSEPPGLAGIQPLLLLGRPLAVGLFVVTVVINSMDRCFCERLCPHVFQEVYERASPPLADFNASSTVSVIVLGIRVVAAGFHRTPGHVLRRCLSLFARTVFEALARLGRIVGSHEIVLLKQVVVRAARRPQSFGCSHYCATPHRAVQ